jgi:peptide-methionine (S)-S-oxide reductase
MLFAKPATLPDAASALPGRSTPMPVSNCHVVHGRPYQPPLPEGLQQIVFGMGCFWGAERVFWRLQGVYSTAVGYAGGVTPNPTYEEVCSGRTGHTEVVIVFFDPQQISRHRLQEVFWESHDPTQGMRQGNDRARSTAPRSMSAVPRNWCRPRQEPSRCRRCWMLPDSV